MKELEGLCESHGTNYENFMAMLNAWDKQIRSYYNEDEKCKVKQAGKGPLILDDTVQAGNDEYDGEPLLQPERDHEDAPVGDRDAPGFLEQQIRKHI
jgi:hypothetical protein